MINRHSFTVVALSLLFVGCGGSKTPPVTPSPPPPPSASAAPAPMPEAGAMGAGGAAGADAGAEAAGPAAPAALDKPASGATIEGTSLSSIDSDGLKAALKKHHWKADSVEAKTNGVYQTVTADISKGKMKGTLQIVRPAQTPSVASGTVTAPADLKTQDAKKKMAVYYDETGDVLVAINVEKKGWAAKGLLRQLVKKAKPGAKKHEKHEKHEKAEKHEHHEKHEKAEKHEKKK